MSVWRHERTLETVLGSLRAAVGACPDRVFLDFSGTTHTYAQTLARSEEMAEGLRCAGVKPGDAVVTMLDNNFDSVCAWFATNLLGGIWVAINTALRGEFLRHVVADTGTRVVLCERDYLARFDPILDQLPELEHVYIREDPKPCSLGKRVITAPLDALRLPATSAGWFDPSPDDVSLLVYTGGTTGPSKGCTISHGYVANLAQRSMEQMGRTADELNWSPLPIFHFNLVANTLMMTMRLQSTAAIAPRFSVSGFWPEVERTGARVVNLLGSMGALIADMPDTPEMKRCFGQIRNVHGEPFPAELQARWRERFGVAKVGAGTYGLTEAAALTHRPFGMDAPPGSSGTRNEEDFDVRIFDEADNELPAGEVGEVVCRPRRPNVMFQGYWRRPEATMAASRNWWFHSGDLGRFDDDGFFYFVDRKKDYLRRRGENISSVEMEQTYLAHPEIEMVSVHAVLSELTEDDVKVTAVLRDGSDLTAEDLFEWSKERVPYFALPRYIEFREELPMSRVGRVHKFQLRDEGCTSATWDRERADVTWERR